MVLKCNKKNIFIKNNLKYFSIASFLEYKKRKGSDYISESVGTFGKSRNVTATRLNLSQDGKDLVVLFYTFFNQIKKGDLCLYGSIIMLLR